MDKGFIKLHRKMLEWEWYDDLPTKVLFLHLLFKVNWEDKKWHGIEIKRGQLLTSQNHLAEETQLSRQQVRRALDNLVATNEITKSTNAKYTIITVCKYNDYQMHNQVDNQQTAKWQPSSNQVATTTKEYKEIKEVKNIYSDIQKSYNEICKTLPRCTVMSPQRKKMIDARLKDYSQEQIVDVFKLANKSDFLSGRNKKWTGCNFDWLMRPNNFIKVIEKTYNQGTQKIQSHDYDFDELERKIHRRNKNV